MSTDDRNAKIIAAVRAGATLRETAERFDLSHEGVRKIVKRHDPGAILAGEQARMKAAIAERRRKAKPMHRKVCKVCGAEYLTTNPRSVTDTPECSRRWARGGLRFRDPAYRKRHEVLQARANLRNPETAPFRIRWSLRVLEEAGEEPPVEYLQGTGAPVIAD